MVSVNFHFEDGFEDGGDLQARSSHLAKTIILLNFTLLLDGSVSSDLMQDSGICT